MPPSKDPRDSDRETVLGEIGKLIAKAPHTEKGDFARVHIAPHSPADVSDDESVGLVVLRPQDSHTGGDDDSPAHEAAHAIFESRGTGPRINKNMVVFAAADSARLEELVDAVAWMTAWQSIVKQIENRTPEMVNVTQGQAESARTDTESATRRVQAMIPETYRWLLLPTQSSPAERAHIDEHQLNGSDSIGLRVSRYLSKKHALLPVMDGPALRFELDEIPLWDGDSIGVEKLLQYFARFTYLPRVSSRQTILEAVRSGVSSLT